MNAAPPLPIRKLRAEMEMKNLSLKQVSALSGVTYSQCSMILNGRLLHPQFFAKIRRAIKAAPAPMEVAA
jgi:transcriptional regulator with XRE-family HTH domain